MIKYCSIISFCSHERSSLSFPRKLSTHLAHFLQGTTANIAPHTILFLPSLRRIGNPSKCVWPSRKHSNRGVFDHNSLSLNCCLIVVGCRCNLSAERTLFQFSPKIRKIFRTHGTEIWIVFTPKTLRKRNTRDTRVQQITELRGTISILYATMNFVSTKKNKALQSQ